MHPHLMNAIKRIASEPFEVRFSASKIFTMKLITTMKSLTEVKLKFRLVAIVVLGALSLGCDSLRSDFEKIVSDQKKPKVVKVGVLHSQTGTLGMSEMSLRHAEMLAIEEINASGELGEVKLDPVVRDGRSRSDIFRRRVRDLIDREKVDVVFGCWTSADRKAVIDEMENPTAIYLDKKADLSKQTLLFYPLQYEGNEASRNVFYFGSTPNQQILPAIDWFLSEQGGNKKRIFLIGSDYIYPRTASYIVKKYLATKNLEVVGESYAPIGQRDFDPYVSTIRDSKPDLVVNMINGDSNIAFFRAMKSTIGDANSLPILSTSVAEDELRRLPPEYTTGHYAAWSYFQSIPSEANSRFVEKVKKEFGYDRVTDDPMEAAYLQVYIWKEAYKRAKSSDPLKIRAELEKGIEFDAPGGKVKVDPKTHHLFKRFRLGQIRADRQFDIIYESQDWIAPEPFPSFAFPGWSCDWTQGGLQKGPPVKLD